MPNEKTLEHVGILGMHWGKRKRSPSRSSKPKASSLLPPKPKKMSEMTEEELQGAIRRKILEQQYLSLEPKKVNFGKELASYAVTTFAKTTVNRFVANTGTMLGDELFKGMMFGITGKKVDAPNLPKEKKPGEKKSEDPESIYTQKHDSGNKAENPNPKHDSGNKTDNSQKQDENSKSDNQQKNESSKKPQSPKVDPVEKAKADLMEAAKAKSQEEFRALINKARDDRLRGEQEFGELVKKAGQDKIKGQEDFAELIKKSRQDNIDSRSRFNDELDRAREERRAKELNDEIENARRSNNEAAKNRFKDQTNEDVTKSDNDWAQSANKFKEELAKARQNIDKAEAEEKEHTRVMQEKTDDFGKRYDDPGIARSQFIMDGFSRSMFGTGSGNGYMSSHEGGNETLTMTPSPDFVRSQYLLKQNPFYY